MKFRITVLCENSVGPISGSLGEHGFSALKGWGIQKVAASHCTGFAASARLSREMPKEFQMALVGYTLEV